MKKIFWILPFVLLVTSWQLFGLDKISVEESSKMLNEKKAVIVDVREADETKEGYVKGAILAPLSVMENQKEQWSQIVKSLPRDKAVLVYCRSGRRSSIVGEELSKKGFKVLNMGGFSSWKDAGLPVEGK